MSERTTVSPSFSPDFTSIAFTELFPNDTCTRAASPEAGQLEQTHRAVVLTERRAANIQDVVEPFELDSPVHLRSGTAPRGNSPVNETSTVTVPFAAAGSFLLTFPWMTALRVSISANWPISMSLAWSPRS